MFEEVLWGKESNNIMAHFCCGDELTINLAADIGRPRRFDTEVKVYGSRSTRRGTMSTTYGDHHRNRLYVTWAVYGAAYSPYIAKTDEIQWF